MSTALKMSIMWHGVAFLPYLRELPFDQLKLACTQASDLSGERVLHMNPDASSQEFELSAFPWHKKLSGAQVITVMVFGLWVLCGERGEMCSALVEAWPIRDALFLAPRPATAESPVMIDAATLEALLRRVAATFGEARSDDYFPMNDPSLFEALRAFTPEGQREQELAAMRGPITDFLCDLENLRKVSVLFAVESGSRAWGFASQNSDWDVRFVYLNQIDEYLRVAPVRDVIENEDLKTLALTRGTKDLDFSGFDLRKFFELMLKSNPSVFEWLASPIVYHEARSNHFWGAVRACAADCFSPKASLYHYVSMAKHNFREHMKSGATTVKLKKYLYITRPLLCCQAILETGLPPPMPFHQVVNMVQRGPNRSHAVQDALMDLVRRKQGGDELMEGPVVPAINAWIEAEIPRMQHAAGRAAEGKPNRENLDLLFSSAVRFPQGYALGEIRAAKYHAALDRGLSEAAATAEAKQP